MERKLGYRGQLLEGRNNMLPATWAEIDLAIVFIKAQRRGEYLNWARRRQGVVECREGTLVNV